MTARYSEGPIVRGPYSSLVRGTETFQSWFISLPGQFISDYKSLSGHFVPGTFRSQIISVPGNFGSGHLVPGSFQPRVIYFPSLLDNFDSG